MSLLLVPNPPRLDSFITNPFGSEYSDRKPTMSTPKPPNRNDIKERRLEMDQTRTESLLQTQLRVYCEAQQRPLEQLQE
jgi:hypothetical protein